MSIETRYTEASPSNPALLRHYLPDGDVLDVEAGSTFVSATGGHPFVVIPPGVKLEDCAFILDDPANEPKAKPAAKTQAKK